MRIVKGPLPPSVLRPPKDQGSSLGSHEQQVEQVKRKCGRPRNPIPRHKRDSHIMAEHRRRGKIQECFQTLKTMVPRYTLESGRNSKSNVLFNAVEHCKFLQREIEKLNTDIAAMDAELETLKRDIRHFTTLESDVDSSSQKEDQTSCLDQYFRSFVTSPIKPGESWASNSVFLLIAQRLFESYKASVAGQSSVRAFVRSVGQWVIAALAENNLRTVCAAAVNSADVDCGSGLMSHIPDCSGPRHFPQNHSSQADQSTDEHFAPSNYQRHLNFSPTNHCGEKDSRDRHSSHGRAFRVDTKAELSSAHASGVTCTNRESYEPQKDFTRHCSSNRRYHNDGIRCSQHSLCKPRRCSVHDLTRNDFQSFPHHEYRTSVVDGDGDSKLYKTDSPLSTDVDMTDRDQLEDDSSRGAVPHPTVVEVGTLYRSSPRESRDKEMAYLPSISSGNRQPSNDLSPVRDPYSSCLLLNAQDRSSYTQSKHRAKMSATRDLAQDSSSYTQVKERTEEASGQGQAMWSSSWQSPCGSRDEQAGADDENMTFSQGLQISRSPLALSPGLQMKEKENTQHPVFKSCQPAQNTSHTYVNGPPSPESHHIHSRRYRTNEDYESYADISAWSGTRCDRFNEEPDLTMYTESSPGRTSYLAQLLRTPQRKLRTFDLKETTQSSTALSVSHDWLTIDDKLFTSPPVKINDPEKSVTSAPFNKDSPKVSELACCGRSGLTPDLESRNLFSSHIHRTKLLTSAYRKTKSMKNGEEQMRFIYDDMDKVRVSSTDFYSNAQTAVDMSTKSMKYASTDQGDYFSQRYSKTADHSSKFMSVERVPSIPRTNTPNFSKAPCTHHLYPTHLSAFPTNTSEASISVCDYSQSLVQISNRRSAAMSPICHMSTLERNHSPDDSSQSDYPLIPSHQSEVLLPSNASHPAPPLPALTAHAKPSINQPLLPISEVEELDHRLESSKRSLRGNRVNDSKNVGKSRRLILSGY